jgi:hypothetical protein
MQMIHTSQEKKVSRNRDLINPRRFFRIGSIIILLFVIIAGTVFVLKQSWEFKKVSVQPDLPLINGDCPILRGVSHTSYSIYSKKINTKAKSILVRNRRFNRHILNFCKDIIISDLHARVRSKKADAVMDWAKNEHLNSLTSSLFYDYRLGIYGAIPKINFRIIIDQLQVDLIPNDSEASIFSIFADSMLKEGASNELTFKGNFRIRLNNSEFIRSSLAIWNQEKNRFYFPSGYVLNNSKQSKTFDIASFEYKTMSEIKSLVEQDSVVLNKKASRPVEFERTKKYFFNLDKKTQKMIILELLATNPSIFNQAGISPAFFLFPNFRLGAFEAGPFVAGK